jgi:hypothetical protein
VPAPGTQQIAVAKLHLLPDAVEHAKSGGGRFEEATPVLEVLSAEGDLPVQPEPGRGERVVADVDGVDPKHLCWNGGIEERHRHRVGLFASGTGQAQDTNHAIRLAGSAGQPAQHDPRKCGQRLGVTKEPRFRHDDQLDERLQLGIGCAHAVPVGLAVVELARDLPLANRPLDGGHADRVRVQAHGLLQELSEVVRRHQ